MSDTLLINNILNAASERKASDVHLVAGNNPVIRVDGKLVTLTDQPVLTPDTLSTISETFLSKEDFERLSKEKEIVAIYTWANRARFRAKVFYQKGYIAISFRFISPFVRSPKELGISAALLQRLNQDKGLILITGPYGSGRTTTAASLIETLNQNRGLNIHTLEQPIEYLFSNNQCIIEQRAVGKDVISFNDGLHDMLDEDVDVVFVGSMYEDGMEELLLELAESGKLVIAIMDSESVISALDRFISRISPDKRAWGQELLADVLTAAVAQRLVPRVGGGLTLAAEILTSTQAVQASIRDKNLHQLNSIMQTSKEEGMVSLDKALSELVRVSEISIEDARKQAINPQTIK